MRSTLMSVMMLVSLSAGWAQDPKGLSSDSRLKEVMFDANQVVPIYGNALIQTGIELDHHEQILEVEIGDKVAWTYAINPEVPYLFFVKPVLDHSNTNLTILTDRRLYHFQLIADANTHTPTFHLRFQYTNDNLGNFLARRNVSTPVLPDRWFWNYTFRGDPAVVPMRLFDDGELTYFEFGRQQTLPSIFVLNEEGQEMLANYRREGRYMVLTQVASQFTLRSGKRLAILTRQPEQVA